MQTWSCHLTTYNPSKLLISLRTKSIFLGCLARPWPTGPQLLSSLIVDILPLILHLLATQAYFLFLKCPDFSSRPRILHLLFPLTRILSSASYFLLLPPLPHAGQLLLILRVPRAAFPDLLLPAFPSLDHVGPLLYAPITSCPSLFSNMISTQKPLFG